MESLNNLQISCKKCNVAFKLGDHVVMTKRTDFFHLLCYKSKGKIYQYFNQVTTFVTWVDSKMLMEEYVAVMNDLIKKSDNKSPNKYEQLQELQITKIRKSEIAAVDDELVQDLKITMQAERHENNTSLIDAAKSSEKLSENLESLMLDVMISRRKSAISAMRKFSMKSALSKSLLNQNQAYKKQIFELRWLLANQDHKSTTV